MRIASVRSVRSRVTSISAIACLLLAPMGKTLNAGGFVNVVCDGSSCVRGDNHPRYDWPTQLAGLLGATSYRVTNLGVDGQPTTAMIANYPSNVAPLYNSNYAGNVYIAWEIYNQLYTNGHDVDAAMSSWWTLCDMARATGYEVVTTTLPPIASIPSTVTEDCNAIMRAHWREHADAIADIAVLPEMVDDTNETYRDPDHIHWTAAGNAVIAAEMQSVVLSLTRLSPARWSYWLLDCLDCWPTPGGDGEEFEVCIADTRHIIPCFQAWESLFAR